MSNIVNPLIEEYIRSIIGKNEGLLKEMEDYADEHHVPIIQPEVAKVLEVIAKLSGANHILEVGTAIGYSSIILSNATAENTKITTIERRKDMIEKAQQNIKKAGLTERIRILEGNAEEILPSLTDSFDFIFLDAAKGQYMEFLSACIHLLHPKGVLVSDNVLYKGMVASNQYVIRRKKTIVKRMRTYLDYIMHHPTLTSCLLPIGDGIAISYKK
ncbi:MAG: O-methyltransferase [Thermotaleaceae bacterium]